MQKFTDVMSSADKVEALEITEETVIVRTAEKNKSEMLWFAGHCEPQRTGRAVQRF